MESVTVESTGVPKVVCSCCGREFDENSSHMIRDNNGELVCFECIAREYERCEDCGKYFKKSELVEDDDNPGHFICKDCAEYHHVICYDCGDLVREDDTTTIGGEYFCENCCDNWYDCDDCGALINAEDAYETNGGGHICESCYSDNYFTCEDCREIFHLDNSRCINDNYYCESCAEDHCEEDEDDGGENDHVMGYHNFGSSRYHPIFCGDEKFIPYKTLLYGVELECDKGSFRFDDFSDWTENDNLIHFEEDGSLSSRGVELITQPCSLRYHQDLMAWCRLLKILSDQGFKSHNTTNCGLHIHISRYALKPTTIVKMDVLINRGWKFFSQIGRRDTIYNSAYDTVKKAKVSKSAICFDHNQRYQAVNTTNAQTVEIRIFRGTLKYETLIGTIEMVDALVNFLDTVSIAKIYETDENILKFVEYCAECHEKYPHVISMMRRLVKKGVTVPLIAMKDYNLNRTIARCDENTEER